MRIGRRRGCHRSTTTGKRNAAVQDQAVSASSASHSRLATVSLPHLQRGEEQNTGSGVRTRDHIIHRTNRIHRRTRQGQETFHPTGGKKVLDNHDEFSLSVKKELNFFDLDVRTAMGTDPVLWRKSRLTDSSQTDITGVSAAKNLSSISQCPCPNAQTGLFRATIRSVVSFRRPRSQPLAAHQDARTNVPYSTVYSRGA